MIMQELILVSGGYRATLIVYGRRYVVFGETKMECILNAVEVYPELVVPSRFYA